MSSNHDIRGNGASPKFSTNPVLERTQSQWIFTSSELLRTPSILEGMPIDQELANRQKGVNFITQVGIMLKLPQITLATASVYLHRFFMRHAMALPNKSGVHHYSVAATALFLATKVEENCRKMRELVVACCRVAQKQPNLVVDEQSKEYWKWRDTILHNEDSLLEALCFDLQIEKPHRILFDFLCYYGVQDNKPLRNTSWAFLNDSHVTTMCLLFSPRTIAGSALYAGAKLAGITIPDDEHGSPWWDHLSLNIFEIQKSCNLMAEVYENPSLPRQGQKDAYSREDDLSIFETTRLVLTPQPERSPANSVRSGSQGIKRDRDDRDDRDDEYSNKWGADSITSRQLPAENGPSPKRLRQGSSERHSQSRYPTNDKDELNQDSSTNDGKKDDVQKRIDAIINASKAPRDNHISQQRRPLSDQTQQSNLLIEDSPESNQKRRPPSSLMDNNTEIVQDRTGRNERNLAQDVIQRYPEGAINSRSIPQAQSRPQPIDESGQPSSHFNGVDDAEKVDYGSEEGEL